MPPGNATYSNLAFVPILVALVACGAGCASPPESAPEHVLDLRGGKTYQDVNGLARVYVDTGHPGRTRGHVEETCRRWRHEFFLTLDQQSQTPRLDELALLPPGGPLTVESLPPDLAVAEVWNLSRQIASSEPFFWALATLFYRPFVSRHGWHAAWTYRPDKVIEEWETAFRASPATAVISTDEELPLLSEEPEDFAPIATNHLLVEGLSRERVVEALRSARGYIAFDHRGAPEGFEWRVETAAREETIGATIPFRRGIDFTVRAPRPCQIRILKDGRVARFADDATILRLRVKDPGLYRVECFQGRDPWILTNPVVITPSTDAERDRLEAEDGVHRAAAPKPAKLPPPAPAAPAAPAPVEGGTK
ncbi:MAG: hypothetical protein HY719_06865 [Planctomycetes bacterium]|nr:hypothetical protein [Planctomycetota bacterium]